jgi:hypothetical protein
MKRYCLIVVLIVSFISGCAKPDHVTTVKSPTEGVFYTVETFNGHGAADSDFTRVYAHLDRNGKSDRKLVVDGTYLEISKITWTDPHDVTLCKQAGITNSFRSEVTLISGDTSETIHNHLEEHCNGQ